MGWNHLPGLLFDCFTRRPDLVLLLFRCSIALKMLCFCIHFAIKYYLCV